MLTVSHDCDAVRYTAAVPLDIFVSLELDTILLMVNAYLQDFGQDLGDALSIWLQSRDPAVLQKEAEKHGGKVSVVLDGKKRWLQASRHFRMDDHK